MEQMELEVDLAASTAKIKVLQCVDVTQEGDDMNAYYDSHHEPETVESSMDFAQLGVIPKTPLHQTILKLHSTAPATVTNA